MASSEGSEPQGEASEGEQEGGSGSGQAKPECCSAGASSSTGVSCGDSEPQGEASDEDHDAVSGSGLADATELCLGQRSSSPLAITDTFLDSAPPLAPGTWGCKDGDPALIVVENSNVASEGSRLHESGRCRPCAFVNTPGGCRQGWHCRFCHVDHAPATKPRARPCKGKRMRISKIIERFKEDVDEYIASGQPAVGLTSHLSSLKLPPMIEEDALLRKTVFVQVWLHVQETHGLSLVESF